LDELGLMPALRWYAQEMSSRYNLPIHVGGSAAGIDVPDDTRLTIFRIAQEAITNAIRHAVADHVTINLEIGAGEIKMTVQDDGQGFNVDMTLGGNELKSLGLHGMIERARLIGGDCEIHSTPGKGTLVLVKCSYAENTENQDSPVAG
jgi:signal transduction histidine kinase